MYSLNETDDENRPQCSQNSTVLDFSFFFKVIEVMHPFEYRVCKSFNQDLAGFF